MANKELARIANALEQLAESYKKISDPATFRETIVGAMDEVVVRYGLGAPAGPLMEAPRQMVLPAGSQIETTVRLAPSPEDVERMAQKVADAMKEELEKVKEYTEQAIKEMSPSTLEKIVKHLEAGEKPNLRRRHGCLSLDFGYGDEEFHISL